MTAIQNHAYKQTRETSRQPIELETPSKQTNKKIVRIVKKMQHMQGEGD